MGSVKDLEIVKKPAENEMGVGRFVFSDRYSVFDYGEMPDHIEGKGAALCLMGAYCFEIMEQKGIKTHYRGLVDKNGKVMVFEELEEPTSVMEINLVNVYKPKIRKDNGQMSYDYSIFTPSLKNCLIPIETMYRNGLPEGSSVFKRLAQGTTTIRELGLDHYPKPGEHLSRSIFDISTKLEEADRYISWEEAQRISGMRDAEMFELRNVLSKVNDIITEIAYRAGLDNEDGKVEFAFDNKRKLMVVDVVGTPDECRFTFHGLHVSKEIARQFYRKTEWYKDIEEAKKKAETGEIKDWRKLSKTKPPKLDPTLKTIIAEMYLATANELTNRKLFDVTNLAQVIKKYRDYVGRN